MEFNDNRTPKRIHVTASPRLKEKFKEINKMASTTPMPPKPVKLKWLIEKQSTLTKTTSSVNQLPEVSQLKIEKQRSSDTYVQRNKPKTVPVNIPAPTIVQKRESVPNNDLPFKICIVQLLVSVQLIESISLRGNLIRFSSSAVSKGPLVYL
uniref:Uncharacterized protein n=1 Tax=Meloidogyne floridensis TaxID=298350 RepID=A0A915PDE3_9BILA